MDKALKLIIRYTLYTLIGSILGTIFYLMYFSLLQFVPEGVAQKINFSDLLRNFFKMLSYTVFVVPVVVMNHKLKRKGNALQCLFYILFAAMSWILLLPFSYKMYDKFQRKYVETAHYNPLSKNEFRQYEDKVYFFAEHYNPDSIEGKDISAVVIDTSENGVVIVDKIPENSDFELIKAANPYRGLLMKNSFLGNKKNAIISFDLLLEKLNTAMSKGWTFILGFMTLGFVLCSIYGLTNLSSWRLINSSNVIFITILVIAMNCLYSLPAGQFIRESSLANNQISDYLAQYVDEPFLCTINILLGFVFIIIGIIRFIFSHKADKNPR